MPIWKLEPVEPLEGYHWRSAYVGPVFVRASDEIVARGTAQDAFGVAGTKPPGGEVPLMPWSLGRFSTCSLVKDSEYEEDGPEAVLGPPEALERVHPNLK